MFGVIGKYLLVTLLIVGFVGAWWLRARSNRRKRQAERESDESRRLNALNLQACPVCGAYSPAQGPGCGRKDCPKA